MWFRHGCHQHACRPPGTNMSIAQNFVSFVIGTIPAARFISSAHLPRMYDTTGYNLLQILKLFPDVERFDCPRVRPTVLSDLTEIMCSTVVHLRHLDMQDTSMAGHRCRRSHCGLHRPEDIYWIAAPTRNTAGYQLIVKA